MAVYMRYLLQIACLAIAISLIFYGAFRVGAAAPAFDHSVCQYPDRLTNPVDGCNNMDPARPECMKFGLEDCELPNPTEPKAESIPIPAPIVAPAPLDEPEIEYIPPETEK